MYYECLPFNRTYFKEMQIETKGTGFHLAGQPKYKNLKVPGVEEDMGKQRTSYTVGENVYWCKLFERLFSLRN